MRKTRLLLAITVPALSLVGCLGANNGQVSQTPTTSHSVTTINNDQVKTTTVVQQSHKALTTVEMENPGVSISFPKGKVLRSGRDGVVLAPGAIDCSGLSIKPDSYKQAIEAGAMLVSLRTPSKIVTVENVLDANNKPVVDEKTGENKTKKVVNLIRTSYGGVLALCKVSVKAKGPDARSYRIRDLDDYLVKGKDGFVSVVASKLDTGGSSWMLWLTDRKPIFKDYAFDLAERKKAIQTLTKAP